MSLPSTDKIDLNLIKKHFLEHFKPTICTHCGFNNHSFDDPIFLGSLPNQIKGYVLVPVTCNKCGLSQLFEINKTLNKKNFLKNE